MGKPSKQISDFMEKFGVLSDELWEIPGSSSCAIKHVALERVAAEQGIAFDPPQIATRDYRGEGVAMLVIGRLGERTEWSFGEASTFNLEQKVSRNGKPLPVYPWAFAEKRAKDRVILKLLNVHGAIYSEEESDEFAKRQNPHVTRPTDIVPEVEYDQNGQPVDNIPVGDDRIERLPKAKAKTIYAELQAELYRINDLDALGQWAETNKNTVETLPADWQSILRGQFVDHRNSLRQRTAA